MTTSQRLEECRKAKDEGTALLAKGKVEAALKEFQRAVQAVPDDIAARKKVAETLARLGRKKEAIDQYQHLAGRYAADGQLVQAIAIDKAILQLDPTHKAVQEALAGLYARKGEGDEKSLVQKLPASMSAALDFRNVRRGPTPKVIDLPEVDGEMKIERTVSDTLECEAVDEVDVEIDTAKLPPTPLFSELPREVFMALLSEVKVYAFGPGQVLIKEGDPGDAMFVVSQGEVDVVRGLGTPEQKVVLSMKEGAFFGEIALVTKAARLASVVSRTDCEILRVDRATLEGLFGRFPGLSEVVQHFCKERLLENLLRSSEIFRLLSEGSRHALADKFKLHSSPAGEVLLVEGQPGRGLYVILRGRCEVAGRKDEGGFIRYPDLGEGDVFGETSLLRDIPVTASVRAAGPSLLLGLDRESFSQHIMTEPKVAQALRELSAERMERTRKSGGEAIRALLARLV